MSEHLLKAGNVCFLLNAKGQTVLSYTVMTDPFISVGVPIVVVWIESDGSQRVSLRHANKSRYAGWKIL